MTSSHADSVKPLRVLLVDGDADYARAVAQRLGGSRSAVTVSHAATLEAADAALTNSAVDLMLLDVSLSEGKGPDWLAARQQLGAAVPVVLLGPAESESALTDALSAGAEDYLAKSASDASTLTRVIRHAIDRHHLREQLQQTGRRFRHLLENATDLIAILDLDGSIVYASPAVVRLLGVSPDILIGSRLWDRIHLDDVLPMQAVILELATEPLAKRACEFRLIDASDVWRTFEAMGCLLTDGPRRQILINARDVSAPRRAEQALAHREQDLRQEQKMEALGRLAGGVAHDFSNVLTVILGAIERLQDRLATDRAAYAEAESIRHAAERAVDLTMQLLTFTKHQVVTPTILPVADVLAGVARFLRPLIGEDIVLQVTVDEGTGSIRADRTQIEQVLLNLAINARDAMPAGGRLTIAVYPTTLHAPETVGATVIPAGDYVVIRVEDCGIGMDEATLARVFEPFFSTKGPGKGTGIGLATVYGIVTQSGGAVALASTPDVGTTATIHLPRVADGIVEPRAPARMAEPTGGNETVLLVEDEHEVRELVRDMLELAGYSVLEAELPGMAEVICREHAGPIHLLLTDVVMPELSGREVATRVRAARPTIRVLFMSGYPEYPGTSKISAFEDVEYLAKPFDRRVLLTRVRGVLDATQV